MLDPESLGETLGDNGDAHVAHPWLFPNPTARPTDVNEVADAGLGLIQKIRKDMPKCSKH